jgi:hypothetical protein
VDIFDIDNVSGAGTVGLIEKDGGKATFVKGDVTSEQDVQSAVDTAVNT